MTTTPDPQIVREGASYPDTARGRIRAFLDAHRPDSARHKTADVLATLPNLDGRGWRHLTGDDLQALLTECVQLERKLSWPHEQPQDEIAAELVATKDALNAAYRERAHLVALLAAQYPSHIGRTDPQAPDWAVVTVELLTGQACWHIAPNDMDLFQHVEQTPRYARAWDGHTTEEKYRRVDELAMVEAAVINLGTEDDLRALVAEVEQLRTDLAAARDDSNEIVLAERCEELRGEVEDLRAQRHPALGNAYAAGWTDALGAIRTPGWAEREAGWKRFLGEADADPEADAKAKFAADMERLRKTDPGGAQWVEHILSERTELSDRQATLLAAIQREGGEWAPIRARGVLVQAGYALTKERAHQIMKQLAARGYLEPVRPRAYTYRLKTEAAQQPERGGEVG